MRVYMLEYMQTILLEKFVFTMHLNQKVNLYLEISWKKQFTILKDQLELQTIRILQCFVVFFIAHLMQYFSRKYIQKKKLRIISYLQNMILVIHLVN